jgi:hypothetical protein
VFEEAEINMATTLLKDVVFRRPSGHGEAHASKDGDKTLCGLDINETWATVSEKDFHEERPCGKCRMALHRILRKGTQLTLW